ncbi:hypothetical protein BV898_11932 [Hypsibius exemplaris]|uniref:CIDE-N domain-containing protein n=1 Tax=Hypsibius exemplaris TaxID=2072580 RepID=A0A1W0WFC7_HYPEX|nr:hypothetical protein BV898_11932 [Hypsibius exemplaris]
MTSSSTSGSENWDEPDMPPPPPPPNPNPKGKPCNVWNCRRSVRKSCVAASFAALTAKGKSKMGIADEKAVRVVLEADGTEVEDDDYFQCLEDFSTFMFLIDQEEWSPQSSTAMFSEFLNRRTSQDSAIGDTSDATDSAGGPSGDHRAEQLFSQLSTDGAYKQLLPWLLLRPADLEEIVNADPEALYARYSRQVVDEIQEMSSKALNDYSSAQKAVELLNLYDKAARKQV